MKRYIKWGLLCVGMIIFILIIRLFLFTSYYIPSKGMENTLLQGDRIVANRWSYGLRLPYVSPQAPYRLAYKQPQSGDIILFNNPADKNPKIYKRNLFIGRCAGIAGDTIIVDKDFLLHEKEAYFSPEQKDIYKYRKEEKATVDSLLQSLNISGGHIIEEDSLYYYQNLSHYEHYLLTSNPKYNNLIIPNSKTHTQLYQLVVPRKGKTIMIEQWNSALVCNTILLHENKQAYIQDGELFVNGVKTEAYTFTQDYYWVITNNSINYMDSRLFGFVPHNHIIAKPKFIWLSKDPESSFFTGFRWNRFLKGIH